MNIQLLLIISFVSLSFLPLHTGRFKRRRNGRKFVKTGTKRNFKSWAFAADAFREVVMRQILESERSPQKSNSSATEWLLGILQNGTWDQYQDELNRGVVENGNDVSLQKVATDFKILTQIMKRSKDDMFGKNEIVIIKNVWKNFFPQSYSNITYTVKWMDATTKYITILAAGYIDLMKKGEFDECRFVEQLNMLKPAIIDAAKTLAYARYQKLGKNDWGGGHRRYNTAATLTFHDSASDHTYKDIPVSQLTGRIFTPLKLAMSDIFMRRMAEKFHALYNESWTGASCTGENAITLDDLEFAYPKQCMDDEGVCIFPCGYYKESKPWCVTKIRNNMWTVGKTQNTWDTCEFPDWNKCTVIPKLKPVSLPDLYTNMTADNRRSHLSVQEMFPNGNSTLIIHDGINAITSLLCGQQCTNNQILTDGERAELNDVITNKIKTYVSTRQGVEVGQDSNHDNKNTEVLKRDFPGSGLTRVVEALIVKAVLEKKRHSDIRSYIGKLRNWNMTNDYIKTIKHKLDDIKKVVFVSKEGHLEEMKNI